MVREYDPSRIPTVHNLREVPPARDDDAVTQTVFRGLDQLIGCTVVGPDAKDSPPHSHSYEQGNVLVSGRLDFVVGDERVTLEPLDAITIPPGVEHASRAVADEPAVLFAFWPLREDRLDATAYQSEFPPV